MGLHALLLRVNLRQRRSSIGGTIAQASAAAAIPAGPGPAAPGQADHTALHPSWVSILSLAMGIPYPIVCPCNSDRTHPPDPVCRFMSISPPLCRSTFISSPVCSMPVPHADPSAQVCLSHACTCPTSNLSCPTLDLLASAFCPGAHAFQEPRTSSAARLQLTLPHLPRSAFTMPVLVLPPCCPVPV